MPIDTPVPTEPPLDQWAGPLAPWRQTRAHSPERLPPGRGEQAAALARGLPSSRVAPPVRVSASERTKPLAAPHDARSAASSTPPPWVAVPSAPAWPAATQARDRALERPDGARLRLRCPASTAPVAVLVRAFWAVAHGATSPRTAASCWPPHPSLAARASMDAAPGAATAWAPTPWRGPSPSCAPARARRSPSCWTRATGMGPC